MTQHLGGRRFTKKKVGLRQSQTSYRLFMCVIPVCSFAFLAAIFTASIFAPVNTSNAAETTVTANVTYGGYSVNLTAAGSVNLALNASRDGVMTVGTSNISISTSSPNGYKLYLGMTGTKGYTNSLLQSDPSKAITSSGTFTVPTPLSNGTWGYAIPSTTPSLLETNGFDETYNTKASEAHTDMNFAAIPDNSLAPEKIAETDTANSTPNIIPVYYGVQAGYSTPTGTYSNTIQYTAIADAGSTSMLYVSPDETPAIDGGETLTLTTTLNTSATDVNVNAYLLTPAQYNSGNPDASVLNNTTIMSCSRSDTLDPNVNVLQLSCTAPAKTVGSYYIYVDLPDYGVHYSKAFSYVANFYNISTMQEMTHNICNDTKYAVTPKASIFNGTNTYGQTGTATSANNADTGNALYRPNHPNDPNYVPQTTLTDTRPSVLGGTTKTVSYTVRKLADGNCWMTENLALNWDSTSYQFTTDTSNVTATRTANVATQALTATGGAASSAEVAAWAEPSTGADWNRWLSRSTNEATENSYSTGTDRTGEDQPLGTYYNWYTATVSSDNTGTSAGTNAPDDICPKGWQLPRYENSGSWTNLVRDTYHVISTGGNQSSLPDGNTAANTTLHGFPLSLPYSGYVARTSGSTVSQGANGNGYFWSAAPSSSTNSWGLGFYGTYVWSEHSYYRTGGFSVRCVAK